MKNKILLFENDKAPFKSIAPQIYSWGYQIIRTRTVEELLQNVSNEEIGAIVLDSAMPDNERIELLTRVRARRSDIATIIFSSYFDQKLMREAGRLKIVAFIPSTSVFSNPESTLRVTLASICKPEVNG